MKTIFMIAALGLLFSCTTQEAPIHDSIPYGSSKQLESIRSELKTKTAGLSFDTKLELCLLDFSFASPEYYKHLQEKPPKDVKTTLLDNEVFVKICKRRKVDPNDIPTDYFSPYK